MDWAERLVDDLAADQIGRTFNFLRDNVDELDVDDGAEIRRRNLLRYIKSRQRAEIVAVGEAAGYQGARWSGIAFTSEKTLDSWEEYARSSQRLKLWSEPSATIVHGLLEELGAEQRVLLWNTVPTHPHRPGEPLSNRWPRAAECRQGVAYACRLIDTVRPSTVVAIGRVAETTLKGELNREVLYVRHPANGGADLFREQMRRLLGR